MDAFYENTDRDLHVSVFRSVEHTWPTHFHANIEIFIVRHGKYEVTRNTENIEMHDGSVAFFDHYDLHSYVNKGGATDDCVIIIPENISKAFDAARNGKKIKTTVIRDQKLTDLLLDAIDEMNLNTTQNGFANDKYYVDSVINYVLCLLYTRLEYTERAENSQNESDYIRKMLIYISEHFRDDITAVSLAAQIGYSREYVSRLFNKYMKESIPSYINKTRAQYVEEQKRISDKRLTELILAAGFKYTSSYYRFINNQKELTKNGTLSESITSR